MVAGGAQTARDNDLLRFCIAVLLACLAPGLLLVGGFEVKSLFSGGPFGSYLFLMAPAFFMASLGVMFFGVAAHFLLVHKNWTGYWHYVLAGIVPGIALGLLASSDKTLVDMLAGCVGMSILTVASAVGFRLGWGRP